MVFLLSRSEPFSSSAFAKKKKQRLVRLIVSFLPSSGVFRHEEEARFTYAKREASILITRSGQLDERKVLDIPLLYRYRNEESETRSRKVGLRRLRDVSRETKRAERR